MSCHVQSFFAKGHGSYFEVSPVEAMDREDEEGEGSVEDTVDGFIQKLLGPHERRMRMKMSDLGSWMQINILWTSHCDWVASKVRWEG